MRLCAVVVVLAGCGSSGSKEPGPRPAPSGATPGPSLTLALPEVTGNGYLPFEKADVEVVISSSALTVDGTPIVGIRNHEIDPTELEGGAHGLKIVKLAAFTKAVVSAKPDPVIALMIDRAAMYREMLAAIVSMKSAGVRRFQLVASVHGARVAAPLVLPDPMVAGVGVAVPEPSPRAEGSLPGYVVVPAVRVESSPRARPSVRTLEVTKAIDVAAPTAPTAPTSDTVRTAPADAAAMLTRDGPPPGISVSVAADRILVWSMSGLEGTFQRPKKTIPRGPSAMVELSTTLAEIVERRWGRDHPRPDNARRVIMLADRNLPLQTVAELLGTLRAAPDGSELFPDVLLSLGLD